MNTVFLKNFITKLSIKNFNSLKETNKNTELNNLDILDSNINPDINNAIDIEEIKSIQSGEKIIEEFNDLLKSLNFENVDLYEVIIDDNETFIQRQHEILGTHYIFLNIEETKLRIITEERKLFIIDTENIDEKIYSIIFTAHIPRKVCIDSISVFNFKEFEKNNIYDITHIIRMFYGKNKVNIKELVELFMDIENDDFNILAYNLFQIKNELNTLLEKNRLMKLFNSETKILEIIAKCSKIGLPFSQTEYLNFKNTLNDRYNIISSKFEENYNKKLGEKFDIITVCNDKGLPATINIDFLKETENIELAGEVVAFNTVNKYNKVKLNYSESRLYLEYNPYNKYGNIESNFEVDNKYIITDKNIAIGKYQDLYFRIFAYACNIDYVIEAMNNNNLIETLSERIFEKVTPHTKLITLCILKAYINGYTEIEEMADFILEEMDTYIDDEEVAMLQHKFKEKCPEIITAIDNFDKYRSIEKRHSLDTRNTMHKYIKLIETDIYKKLICLVYENIINYNNKNKNKIHIVGLLDNKIVLEANDSSIDVAVDILNRNLTRAYESYIKKVKVVSITTNSKKLK